MALIEDTYAEASDGFYIRGIVTADDEETLRDAAKDSTAMSSEVMGRLDCGIEKWLSERETPDKRKGAILQFWKGIYKGKSLEDSLKRLEKEFSYRVRQGIMVKPLTAVFDAPFTEPEGRIDMMERVGHCGDSDEWEKQLDGRSMIVVPTMVPDFLIERYVSYAKGISGGNFCYMCKTKETMKEAGKKALEAISQIEGVITPFGICAAGSKTETKFPLIGPTTNSPYCLSLKWKQGENSKVPEGVNYIPEIVINGVSLQSVKKAMKVGIEETLKFDDVVKISAGNYKGELGQHKIYLREL